MAQIQWNTICIQSLYDRYTVCIQYQYGLDMVVNFVQVEIQYIHEVWAKYRQYTIQDIVNNTQNRIMSGFWYRARSVPIIEQGSQCRVLGLIPIGVLATLDPSLFFSVPDYCSFFGLCALRRFQSWFSTMVTEGANQERCCCHLFPWVGMLRRVLLASSSSLGRVLLQCQGDVRRYWAG